jgi:hypothetical protein
MQRVAVSPESAYRETSEALADASARCLPLPPEGTLMPMVHECAYEGCHILTMSLHCLDHERATDLSVTETLLDAASAAAGNAREAGES